jgi:signal transduction histidine kinase
VFNLDRELWNIDAESGWTEAEVQAVDGETKRLKKYLEELLCLFHLLDPGLVESYAALAGVGEEHGWFQPLAAEGRDLSQIQPQRTSARDTPLGRALHGKEAVVRMDRSLADSGDAPELERLVIRLEAHGEFYGFLCLASAEAGHFGEDYIQRVRDTLPVLCHSVADAVFSMRLRILAAPFRRPANGKGWEAPLYNEIARRTASGFAADGAVLRIYDVQSGLLTARAWTGDVEEELLVEKRLGEGITGTVLAHPQKSWALFMTSDRADPAAPPLCLGVELPREDIEFDRRVGLESFLIMRLTSEVTDPGEQLQRLGTLSLFHRRPHRFSWREISAFKSFCQRVTDTILLYRTNEDLSDNIESLRIQGQAISRVEIVALLAHDLGHKAFAACNDVDDYIRRVRRSMNDRSRQQTHSHLEPYANRALESVVAIQSALDQILNLYKGRGDETDRITEFDVRDVFHQIETSIKGALERSRIGWEATYRGDLRIRGQKMVLFQAMFNLVINSIEAMRSRKRGGAVHIHASLEQLSSSPKPRATDQRVVIQFWDDGPGIDVQRFPDATRIFEIGQSSKREGSGTGLSASRFLLGRYFGGTLSLEDRAKARFRITIPVR